MFDLLFRHYLETWILLDVLLYCIIKLMYTYSANGHVFYNSKVKLFVFNTMWYVLCASYFYCVMCITLVCYIEMLSIILVVIVRYVGV